MVSNIIRSILLAIAGLVAVPAWALTTYTFTGGAYANVDNCTAPGTAGAGPCVAYTSSMRVTGWFSLSTPLPPNFGPADISTRPDLAYSFSDGINQYSSADTAHVYIPGPNFKVATDNAGVPLYIGTQIAFEAWQTTPGVNNYLNALATNYLPFSAPPPGEYVSTGWQCFSVDVNNQCGSDNYGANIARAWGSAAPGVWTMSTGAAGIPTLDGWSFLLLAAMLTVAASAAMTRRRR